MPEAENNLQAAFEAYESAVSLITAMTEALQQTPITCSAPDLIEQYDRILQGILLHVAFADGSVSEVEYQFIRTITRHGDLLDTLNHRHDSPAQMTWSDFGSIPRQLCKRMIKICDQVVADTTASFITKMAHLDNATPRIQELSTLRGYTTTIMEALSELDRVPDSSDLKREAAAGARARLKLLERPWNDALSYL